MRALVLLCVAAAAGLWAWALLWPKEARPLPDGYAGTYRLYRFEPAEGVEMANPYPRGEAWYYVLRPDGSYVVSVRLTGGDEMSRREGTLAIDERGTFTFSQVSENRRPLRAPPQRFRSRWEPQPAEAVPVVTAPRGAPVRVLVLTEAQEGYDLYLAPVGPSESP